jgi:hypothetical protein
MERIDFLRTKNEDGGAGAVFNRLRTSCKLFDTLSAIGLLFGELMQEQWVIAT